MAASTVRHRLMASLLVVTMLPLAASDRALAQPSALPPPPPPVSTPAPGLAVGAPLSPDEFVALRDVEDDFLRFMRAADLHQLRLKSIVRREFDDRMSTLEKRYAQRIAAAERIAGERGVDMIARLEAFIARYPEHKKFTPDAMFRLADLYLDKAETDFENDTNPDVEPIVDYSRAVALWETILGKFPDYRQFPSVLYLVGHYGKSKDERRSLIMFLALTCANRFKYTDVAPPVPTREEFLARKKVKELNDLYAGCEPWPDADPELLRHAWVRGVADYHFNVPGEIDETISAYLHVVKEGNASPMYAEALYKLAWSYYKRDFLKEAIDRFDESVMLYDATVAGNQTPSLELREESLQYIAVAFTDPWEGETDTDPIKAFARAKEYYNGREDETHVRDIWVAMGNAFLELQAFDQAIEAFRIAIGPPWELEPTNPLVHQEIVNAYDAKGDKSGADDAAAELAARYAEGTPWFRKNEKDRVAMEAQRRIAERALYAAARNTHVTAGTLRREWVEGGKTDVELRAASIDEYQKAIELYQAFIRQYPESEYVYDFTFYMAEALFFSERYDDAVVQYSWVRDHRDLSTKFLIDAAKGTLASYEAEAARQVAAGTVAELVVPTPQELAAMPKPLVAKPIPRIYQLLQAEWDTYQDVVPDPATAPQQGLNAALVSLAYLHIDDAVTRLSKVQKNFCGSPESVKAKDGLLGIYEATGRLDKFEETNAAFIAAKCGDAKALEIALGQNRSLEFRKANELFGSGQYMLAAEAFYRYYKTTAASDPDAPTALYNAAVAYKLADRPKTAIALFKQFTENRDKPYRESAYYLEAMRLTAASHQSVFDYRTAIAQYLELYEVAKSATKRGIKPLPATAGQPAQSFEKVALDALYNAAALAELDRDFRRALDLYTRYEREESVRRQKDRALWALARIYRAQGDTAKLAAAYDRWRKAYGADAGNEEDYVASYYELAKAYQRKGRSKDADDAGRQAIRAWDERKAIKSGGGARMAGEYELLFAERYFASEFDPFRITKAAKKPEDFKKDKAALERRTLDTQAKYDVMKRFGIPEYLMAAEVRYGETLARLAEKLAQMPIPTFIQKLADTNPDAIAAYEEGVAKEIATKGYLTKAKEVWSSVVELGKTRGISNEWTQLALENLGREFPDEYTVQHQELFEGTTKP
ncbi:MAG: tetratricopeptide repeat protein [Myxococcales bacterium]|nr:tetratricopeptide repeat protein [Myxococcales bacterium]